MDAVIGEARVRMELRGGAAAPSVRWRRWVVGWAVGCAASLGGVALAAASDGTPAAAATPAPAASLDPVVAAVVKMLEAKVSPEVIAKWLAQSGKRPAEVGSDDLVALRRAGAPDSLQERLMSLATHARTEPTAPGAATVSASPQAPLRPLAATPVAPAAAASPAPVQPPAATPAATSRQEGRSHVQYTIDYRPFTAEDEKAWNLYVYLDGAYLGSVRTGAISWATEKLVFDRDLPAGPHVLRVTQERHLHRADGWHHETRVSPAALPFTLQPAAASVAVVFRDVTLRHHNGPVTLRVTQGDAPPLILNPATPEAARWPSLCDDLDAGAQQLGKRRQEHCVPWSELWPGASVVPLAVLRARLERDSFQPGPAPANE